MLVIILSMIHQFFDEPPFIVNSHRLFFISYFLVFISLFKRKILEKSPFLLVFLFLITVVVNQRLAVLSVDTKYSIRLHPAGVSVDMVSSFKTLTLRGIPFSSSSLFKFRGFCGLPTSVCMSNRCALAQVRLRLPDARARTCLHVRNPDAWTFQVQRLRRIADVRPPALAWKRRQMRSHAVSSTWRVDVS